MNFITTIYAANIYDVHNFAERTYNIKASCKHDAIIDSLNMFWKEVDNKTYSFIDQDITEVS
jgi:hypothetical protein